MKQLLLFKEITTELKEVEKRLAEYVGNDDLPLLGETSTHLLAAGGKRLRPAFVLLVGKLFQAESKKVIPLAMALELIHMASLVHDDVVDAAMTRRGRLTVKANWGNRISIHTGDHLFAQSLILIAGINNPEISRVLAEVSIQMSMGEIQQISSAFNVNQNLRDYFYRIKRKTAMLISASCELSAIACGASRRQIWALGAYGHALGMAFQIVDDILDVTAKQSELGKPIGGDLRQGIITLPMLCALRTAKEKERLKQLLATQRKSEAEVLEAIKIIVESPAIQASFDIAERYKTKAKAHLAVLPNVPVKKALEQLADFIVVRKF